MSSYLNHQKGRIPKPLVSTVQHQRHTIAVWFGFLNYLVNFRKSCWFGLKMNLVLIQFNFNYVCDVTQLPHAEHEQRSPRRTSWDRFTQPSVLVPVQTRSSSTSPDFLPCCRNNSYRTLVAKKMNLNVFVRWRHVWRARTLSSVWLLKKHWEYNKNKNTKKSCSLQIETFKKNKQKVHLQNIQMKFFVN